MRASSSNAEFLNCSIRLKETTFSEQTRTKCKVNEKIQREESTNFIRFEYYWSVISLNWDFADFVFGTTQTNIFFSVVTRVLGTRVRERERQRENKKKRSDDTDKFEAFHIRLLDNLLSARANLVQD